MRKLVVIFLVDMDDCVFCRIVAGKEETKIIKETENLVVFEDINPQASIHLLIVPKKHVADISELDDNVWREIKETVVYMASEKSLEGFRLIHNAGTVSTIPHMQIHFLADISPAR